MSRAMLFQWGLANRKSPVRLLSAVTSSVWRTLWKLWLYHWMRWPFILAITRGGSYWAKFLQSAIFPVFKNYQYTGHSRSLMVLFIQQTHKRHPLGQVMGYLLWVHGPNKILAFSSYCVQYHIKYDHDISWVLVCYWISHSYLTDAGIFWIRINYWIEVNWCHHSLAVVTSVKYVIMK